MPRRDVATSSDSSSRIRRIFADLIGVRLGQLALAEIEAVLQPDPDIATHLRGHREQAHLVAARAEHRPLVVLAEQLVGDALHVDQVVRVRADAAEDPEDRLDEERRLDQSAFEEVGQVVQVADVVALELEARPECAQPSAGRIPCP